MKSRKHIALLSFALLVFCSSLNAQSSTVVPGLVNFSGKAVDAQGKPISGTTGATFAIYKEQSGGAPLWLETQNIQADAKGKYTVQLGASKPEGLPLDLFASGEARWLGVAINEGEEQPRVLLVSVPYALKAADAETLGGKPASAFMAAPVSGAGAGPQGPQAEQPNEIACSSSSTCKSGFVPLFATNGGSAKVTDSIVTQSGGTVQVAGSEGVTGNLSTAGAITASLGVTSQSPGIAVYGETSGSGGGADGVHGVAHGAGSGVTGVSDNTGGVGVWGQGPGYALYANGNTGQARTAGGWLKAMLYYSGFNSGRIVSCFNSTLAGAAATTPPCGFSATKNGTGDYTLDFGFEIDDRFFSVTNTNWFATTGLCTNWNGACSSGSWTPSQVEVFSFLPEPYYNTYADTKFYLMVF